MSRLGLPNCISLGRILLVPVFVFFLVRQADSGRVRDRLLAIGVFAVMALSDWVDGYLARRLRQETALGRILDPAADKLLVICAVVLLWRLGVACPTESGDLHQFRLPGWVVGIAISRDLLVCLGALASRLFAVPVRLQARTLGKWCTAAQLALVLAMLLLPGLPGEAANLPVICWWISSALAVAAAADYVAVGIRALEAWSFA
ncbi:MAG: CDP-alcohol phosphatidyltransferase family protein [Phycisphaerae bacterium]|nr:CDP-alcohol phosphatidyltransferase family protein [Phycisphaerae bacterium]